VSRPSPEPLRAPLDIEFDYTRSLGPVLGRFMAGLADRRILGVRGADGRLHAPPFEYDPVSSEPAGELTEVGPEGTVLSWSWMPEPLEGQPLTDPFAWALIRLDGADTAILHAVDTGSAAAMRTGLRVRPRWAASRVGSIRDIACFEPCDEPAPAGQAGDTPRQPRVASDPGARAGTPGAPGPDAAVGGPAAAEPDAAVGAPAAAEPDAAVGAPAAAEPDAAAGTPAAAEAEPLAAGMTVTPVRLHYVHTASPGESAYLRGLAEGRLTGQRCGGCGQVYIPPRGTCPADGVPMTEEVELPDTGTVTTFCVVNVGYPGQRVTPPYVAAAVLLDGADIAFQHLILGCDPGEVRMGMRVRAVWRPPQEQGISGGISHFAPTGEPDAPYETYARQL
jgi:uncharacterized protein